jgi:hypothetical protein
MLGGQPGEPAVDAAFGNELGADEDLLDGAVIASASAS